jgi:cobalt-zinc-cadmium resistance protein CzcA
MIQRIVDSALSKRLFVIALAVVLFVWGMVAFQALPVEAYPDVANNYVQVITQWPGRAAEEVEQQVTIPIEIVMNGIPHMENLRSTSLFGLSSVTMIFDDESSNEWNRQKVLERLGQVTLPVGLQPQMGTDYSPVGQIMFYTLKSTNPQYDVMDLKALEDWTLEKQFKSVPNVVDVSSFGGATREYQVQLDPDKLIAAVKKVSLADTPRGPVKFDDYGNLTFTVYIRKVEKKDGKLVNTTVKSYPDVSQFWHYDPKKFLEQPVFSRDFPPLKT